MPDEIQAFVRCEEVQRDRNELDHLVEGARPRGAEERFQLRKRHLNRIEVGTVGRQKSEPRARAFDRGLDLRLLVHGQVVQDHDIAGAQGRDQDLLDVSEKRRIVERAVKDGGRVEAVHAQRRDHRVRLPVAARRVIAEPQASWAAPIPSQQVGSDPRFIDEDIAAGVVDGEEVLPPPSRGRDVRAPLFVGVYRFF